MNNVELKEFTDQFLKVPDNDASKKQKHIRANNYSFMTELLRKNHA